MSKDLWMEEEERIGEEYVDCQISRQEAMERLGRLGFDAHEIIDHMSELDADRGPEPAEEAVQAAISAFVTVAQMSNEELRVHKDDISALGDAANKLWTRIVNNEPKNLHPAIAAVTWASKEIAE